MRHRGENRKIGLASKKELIQWNQHAVLVILREKKGRQGTFGCSRAFGNPPVLLVGGKRGIGKRMTGSSPASPILTNGKGKPSG